MTVPSGDGLLASTRYSCYCTPGPTQCDEPYEHCDRDGVLLAPFRSLIDGYEVGENVPLYRIQLAYEEATGNAAARNADQ